MKNPTLGLICKTHNYTQNGTNIITGDWTISPSKIESLMGQDVILTEGSMKEAYLGGKITGFSRLQSGKYSLEFAEDSSYSGYSDHISSWGNNPGTNPVRYLSN